MQTVFGDEFDGISYKEFIKWASATDDAVVGGAKPSSPIVGLPATLVALLRKKLDEGRVTANSL